MPAMLLKKIRKKFLYISNDLGNLWGRNLRFFNAARGARILVYHGICEEDHLRYNNSFITRKTFEQHLEYYNRYFNVISLNDYFQQKWSPDRFNICITFDDGYANNYKYAFPLLSKYAMPAAFFITGIRDAGRDILWNDAIAILSKHGPKEFHFQNATYHTNKYGQYVHGINNERLTNILREGGFDNKAEAIGTMSGFYDYRDNPSDDDFWQQLTPDQIQQMAASPLVTIGCHGYYHTDLARVPLPDAAAELQKCRHWLQQLTGKPINALAFPYGSYTRDLVTAARDIGFDQLLALDYYFDQDNSDPALRERFVINPYISTTNQMIATIKKTYAF